jgi:hypothetical protein
MLLKKAFNKRNTQISIVRKNSDKNVVIQVQGHVNVTFCGFELQLRQLTLEPRTLKFDFASESLPELFSNFVRKLLDIILSLIGKI